MNPRCLTAFHRLLTLSMQCDAIAPGRSAGSRYTHFRRRLALINLPLQSVVHRVRRRLVLCDEAEFERHVRGVLEQFRRDLVSLTQGVGNRLRTKEVRRLTQAAIAACEA